MHALSVIVEAGLEEDAAAHLWERGTRGIEVRPLAGGRVELLAYFDQRPDPLGIEGALGGAVVADVAVPDVDWVANFRASFRAFDVGRFTVTPLWEASGASPERLIVDPGRAFGTGTHETTRLCIGALEDLAARRPLGRTLDLGSGTGLLAVAAARLGAGPVVASDVDPEATASSRLHARLNATRLHVVQADGGRPFRPGGFDLVLANLMALFLIDRAHEVQALVAPGGALVLSGLLRDDVPPVREAYAASGRPREHMLGEWAALVFETGPTGPTAAA